MVALVLTLTIGFRIFVGSLPTDGTMRQHHHSHDANSYPRQQAVRDFRERVLLVFLLLGTLGLRLWHLTWGLPDVHEVADPFTTAWRYWNWGAAGLQFNPHAFSSPALSAHIQFAAQVLHYGIGRMLGTYADLEAYRLAFVADPTNFLALGRLATALMDVGTVWLVYILGRRIAGGSWGLVAAALVGVNALHVQQAQVIAAGTPATFFVVLALLCIIRVHDTGTTGWYIYAGISVGLAAATKYTAGLLLVSLCAASLLRATTLREAIRSLRTGELIGGGILALIVFLQLNPFIVLDRGVFLHDVALAWDAPRSGGAGSPGSPGASLALLPDVMGWPLLIIVGGSLIVLLGQRRRADLLLVVFPLLYAVMLALRGVRADHQLLPIVSSLVLVGVRGMQEAWGMLFPGGMEARGGARTVAAIVIGAAVLVRPVTGFVARESARALPDTREVAREWIASNIPANMSIAVQAREIELPLDRYFLLPIPYNPARPELMAPFYTPAWYTDLDYVIAGSIDYTDYARNQERYRPLLAFIDSLKTRWKLVYNVRPAQRQSGPELWIFQPPRRWIGGLFDSTMIHSLSMSGNPVTSINFAGKLAMILSTRGVLDRSTQLLQYVVRTDPRNRSGYRELASVYYQRGKLGEALQAVDTALRLEPNDAEMLAAKGNMLMDLKRTVEAEPMFRRALEVDRQQEAAYIGLDKLYELRGDRKKAVEVLREYRATLRPGDDKIRVIDEKIRSLGG